MNILRATSRTVDLATYASAVMARVSTPPPLKFIRSCYDQGLMVSTAIRRARTGAVSTEAQRRAIAVHQDKLKADGWARKSVWLSPEAQEVLEPLRAKLGSYDAAILALAGVDKPSDA